MKRTIVVIIAVILGATMLSYAHDTWLLADRAAVETGTDLILDLTSGMAFPATEYGIKADRVDRAQGRIGKETFPITISSHAKDALHFSARLARKGVATLWVELLPRPIDLKPEQVEEYLEEIGAGPAVMRRWAGSPEPKRWHEIYTKHSKTYVRVGKPDTEKSWAKPAGMALEIIPEKDPTTLHAGDTLPVRLVTPEGPVPHMTLGLVHEGDTASDDRVTDAQGRTTFSLDQPGRWLLRATVLRPSGEDGGDWLSDFTTLTIEVHPRQ